MAGRDYSTAPEPSEEILGGLQGRPFPHTIIPQGDREALERHANTP